MDGDRQEIVAAIWREHRPFLVDLAFRMLGNIGDAEDVVQDAFTRLLRVDPAGIDDRRAWLVVVVTRRCLDILRSARVRRETRPDPGADPFGDVPAAGPVPDPADRITLDDSVRLALYVVLEQLGPAERAVFVLHEVFRYPFESIASIVGRPAGNCRKAASRARRRIEAAAGPARFAVAPDEHRQLAERFIAACADGDLDALTRLLSTDVVGKVDLGAGAPPAPVLSGRHPVARNLLRHLGGAAGVVLVSQPVNGWPGALAFKDGRLHAVLIMEVEDGLVADIHAIRNPQALAGVGRLVEARR
ncbi:MAG TPA: RNA polymerase sigma factor SigI [Acidimicrobiia bacterium]|nr:RNA polymerase sigma factor SigI [Acidimicrobiia bacterium]